MDSDFATCQGVVLGWFKTRLDNLSLDQEYKDTKTQLQEYLQARKLPLPEYKLLKTRGQAHEQIFTVECKVESLNLSVEAESTTRRKAEKEAAKHILEVISNAR